MLHLRPSALLGNGPVNLTRGHVRQQRLVCAATARPKAAGGHKDDGPGKEPSRPRRHSSASKIPSESAPPPAPAVQLANSLAEQSTSKPADDAIPSPAVQLANSLADSEQQPPSATTPGPRSPVVAAGSAADPQTPADMLNEGIRSAASSAEEAITQSAAAASAGIAVGTNLTTQGITAAQAAAEETVNAAVSAAESTLNAAAAAVGGAAGAVDGLLAAASNGSSSRAGNGASSATATSSFDTVNVRVPATMAWANDTPARGRIRDMTLTQDFDEDEVEGLKVNILAAVASLDRGLAANVREASEVDKLARVLEDAAGPVTLKWSTSRSSPDASTMDRLAGTWRLIYSSGFNGGSLGGSRPGPPAALVPTILGQVYQVIDADKMVLDNVVELLLNYGVPQLPFLPRPDPQPSPGLRLTLRHTYEVAQPNSVTIVFESTAAKAIGPDVLQGLPQFGLPELPDFLKPPKNFRSASFDVTYLDASMRITRGDRGELRIYLRDKPLEAATPADYID